jgi:K+-sensing histidine kinase KdpD
MSQLPTTTQIEHLYAISKTVTQFQEWKDALNEISRLIRSILIFDNLVVYLNDPGRHSLEVVYARAAGRGRSAEADSAWGETVALQSVLSRKTINQEPAPSSEDDRLKRPFFLTTPLQVGSQVLGAIVFIRFGGPIFNPEEIELAEFVSRQITLLVERQQIQQQFKELEAQNQQARLQNDFVSTISHELRSPLGFIKGFTTTLLRSDTQWDQATQLEFLRIIDQETDRLLELIGNLLDSARLQSGQLRIQFQLVRLDSLLNDVMLRSRMHHPDLNISITIPDKLSPITADPVRITQVLDNLISNSLKYAPGSDILITINQDENSSVIKFQDFGPGIPEQYMPYIFERFFRSPDAPNIHGSGLGLYICKHIIQTHGGEITASSKVGNGTTVEVRLPNQAKTP